MTRAQQILLLIEANKSNCRDNAAEREEKHWKHLLYNDDLASDLPLTRDPFKPTMADAEPMVNLR